VFDDDNRSGGTVDEASEDAEAGEGAHGDAEKHAEDDAAGDDDVDDSHGNTCDGEAVVEEEEAPIE